MGRFDSPPQGQAGGIQLGSWGSPASSSYSKVESSAHSEFDMPLNFRAQRKAGKCRSVAVCVVLLLVAGAIVLGVLRAGRPRHDDSTDEDQELTDQSSIDNQSDPALAASSPAPSETDAPSEEEQQEQQPYDPSQEELPSDEEEFEPSTAAEDATRDEAYAPNAAPDAPTEPELHAYGPAAAVAALSLEDFCDVTAYPDTCYKTFAAIPNAEKGDLQQWTILAINASAQAVNESLTLALQMQSRQDGNMALEQCIDLERDSLDRLNATMFLVAEMNLRSPEKTDALTYMSAVMTNEDTCQDGINEVGGWQGSDKLTGAIHHQIAELLDISLSFTNSLATSELDADHHRRLLQIL
ncbi:unnamed protein product [Sphagnum troendelagicum]